MATNKKCLCCGTSYYYCPSCSRADALKPSYFSEFCCEECMVLWTTATKYNLGILTKSEAKAIISKLNLKPTEEYAKCIQRDLGVILAEEPKPKRGKRAAMPVLDEVATPVVDEAIAEEIKSAVEAAFEEITDSSFIVELEPVLEEDVHEVVTIKEE